MKIIENKLLFIIVVQAFISGCVSSGGDGVTGDNRTLYKNPNPKVEFLHVRAYNLDLGVNGVKQNRAKANKFYLQAANMGDPRSMMNYAINRFYGVGTKKDKVDALCWIDKSRFLTQRTMDRKLKWRVRGMRDKMKKEAGTEVMLKAHKKCKFMMAF